jgi:transposase
MKALSMDLRTRIIAAIEEGIENMREIAERFSVHYKTVQKLKYQWRDTKSIEPRVNRVGRRRALSDSQRKRLDELIRSNSNLTLEQLRDRIQANCCAVTIWNEVRRLGHTYKKAVARRGATTSRRAEIA